ncbi:Gfo/Idh/MocA family protein [Rubrivivax rivuli]|uniref:Gfo/Idh/MocA family oxidoreductase n=1 Tax=Rubrivivax rivuli TaxID=1862385 RepID=A0A437RL26_9BURK|nr:Gfo/Idh/MocA family oxidoreductase [Rubrivivax rivuli]RVU47503.1 Gfo/Idh/MocA family oxidoreductase [Rubrivivax rivuli]
MSDLDFRWGLIGPGAIAHRFAEAVQGLPGARLVAVAGRDEARSRAFAERWSGPAPVAASPSVAALLSRGDLDAVYIATPHSAHAEAVRACLQAGLPVLCEKPLVPTLAQARPLVALARERGVFLMEALWSRFLPLYGEIGAWLRRGDIGPLRAVHSSFAFRLGFDPSHRCFAPALAGGALLDIGVYNVALSRWALEQTLGACPALTAVHAQGLLAPTGVDQRVSAQLVYEGGAVVQFFCAFDSEGDNSLHLLGERGSIVVPQAFWQGTRATLVRQDGETRNVERPFEINGFEGEIREAMRCVRAGLVESPGMPHAESLALVATLDRLRAAVGVRYPFDNGQLAP